MITVTNLLIVLDIMVAASLVMGAVHHVMVTRELRRLRK